MLFDARGAMRLASLRCQFPLKAATRAHRPGPKWNPVKNFLGAAFATAKPCGLTGGLPFPREGNYQQPTKGLAQHVDRAARSLAHDPIQRGMSSSVIWN